MILFINTAEPEVRLALIGNKKISELKFTVHRISESLLPEVLKLLKKNKLNLPDLKKIAVVTGPGPFSRMRTAVVTANALAFALKIPVIGMQASEVPENLSDISKLKTSKQVLPFYQKPPNITKPKKK